MPWSRGTHFRARHVSIEVTSGQTVRPEPAGNRARSGEGSLVPPWRRPPARPAPRQHHREPGGPGNAGDHCVRILVTANYLDAAGGLERTQLSNCRSLARRGHRLDLVFVHGGAFENEWDGITATMTRIPATLPRAPARPIRSSLDFLAAVRQARRLQPEVIYVYRYWDLPFAVAVASARRASVVYHLCLPPPEPLPRWLRVVLRRVDYTVSVSEHTLALWEGTGLDPGRAHGRPDVGRPRPLQACRRARASPGTTRARARRPRTSSSSLRGTHQRGEGCRCLGRGVRPAGPFHARQPVGRRGISPAGDRSRHCTHVRGRDCMLQPRGSR